MINLLGMKSVVVCCQLVLVLICTLVNQSAHAKWDEERDVTTNGKEELVYYYKTNEQGQKLVNMLPRKRIGHPEDLDSTLLMLCAPQSHFINGAVIAADDGFGV